MPLMRRLRLLRSQPQRFDRFVHGCEGLIARILALTMLVVIAIALVDLWRYLIPLAVAPQEYFLGKSLVEIFGFFLSVLIAVEILQNITSYLKSQRVQLELVLITALTAVARKLIILDLDKVNGLTLLALGLTILAIAISYVIIRHWVGGED